MLGCAGIDSDVCLLAWRIEMGVLPHFALQSLPLTLAIKEQLASLKVISLDALLGKIETANESG